MGERLLLRFGLSPCRWREIFDLVDLGRREADKQVLKILERIDPMPLATAQKGINHCATFAGFRVTNEHSIVLARELDRTFVTNVAALPRSSHPNALWPHGWAFAGERDRPGCRFRRRAENHFPN